MSSKGVFIGEGKWALPTLNFSNVMCDPFRKVFAFSVIDFSVLRIVGFFDDYLDAVFAVLRVIYELCLQKFVIKVLFIFSPLSSTLTFRYSALPS